MIRNLLFIPLMIFAFTGCTRTKPQDTNMQGNWHIQRIAVLSGAANYSRLDFVSGGFIFNDDGSMQYQNLPGELYKGSWIVDDASSNNCYTDANGDNVCTTTSHKTLQLDAEGQFPGHPKKTAFFDKLIFTGPDSFDALLIDNFTTYKYSFARMK